MWKSSSTIRKRYAELLGFFPLAVLSFVIYLIISATMPAQARDSVIAKGNPPLTQEMIDRYSDMLEWAFDVHFTAEQRQRIYKSLITIWQMANRTEMDDVIETIEAQEELLQIPKEELILLQPQVEEDMLAQARKETGKDPMMQWILEVYNSTHEGNNPTLLQERAIKQIDHFIDHFRKTGDRKALLPELQEAANELAESLDLFMRNGDLAGAALSLIKLGDIHRMQDRWNQALDLYQQAEDLAKQIKHPARQAKALMGQARTKVYGLRDYGSAAIHIEEAVRLSALVEDKSYLFDALDYKAQIEISRGDLITAADTLNRAFSVATAIDDQALLFFGYLDRAEVYQKLAEKCDYNRTFEPCYEALGLAKADYQQALTLSRKLGYHGLANETKGFLQRLEERRELIKAQERSHKELSGHEMFHPKKPGDVLVHEQFISGTQEIPPGLLGLIQQAGGLASVGDARSFYIQGLFHEMQGGNDAAMTAYLKAIELLETDRRNIRDEKSRGTFLEDKIGFYYQPILHFLQRGRLSDAFDLLERSRSRGMADILASKQLMLSRPKDQELYADSLKIKANIALLQKELFEHRIKPDREKYTDKIDIVEKEIEKMEGKLQGLLGKISKESPRLKELIVSNPVSLQKLQESMRQDRFDLLQYLVLEHTVILWHISGDTIHVRSVSLPRSELINKVSGLRKSLTDRNIKFDEQTAREMFLFLIQPALKWIKTDHLVIIPHEDLNYIPFQVFQDPSNNSYLGEQFQISYAPNATILFGLKKSGSITGGRLLAIADPDIIEAIDEVEAIAKLYPDRNKVVKDRLAKEADLKAWAGEYSLLHLSVHGKFIQSEPLLSYLNLNKGGQEDGRLTAAEMFGLPLEKVSLVVLSACETGQAEVTHANEILGMVRALLYAGANTLVLSSWEVDAASTALWMKTFYKEALDKPLSEAARLALVAVKKHPDFNHPYFWSPFMMVGR